jgi:CTP synthase
VSQISVDGRDGPPEVSLVEVGGTVGDIESMVFLEALRQLQRRVGRTNFAHVHVSLVPEIEGEQKSKPTQHGVKELRGIGLVPDIIACRCDSELCQPARDKLSLFCDVEKDCVISVHNTSNIWRVPLILREQSVHKVLETKLQLPNMQAPGLVSWDTLCETADAVAAQPDAAALNIAIVGKYTLHGNEAYKSVVKSLTHSTIKAQSKVRLV